MSEETKHSVHSFLTDPELQKQRLFQEKTQNLNKCLCKFSSSSEIKQPIPVYDI